MWIGRFVPAIAWAFWLVAILVPDFGQSDSAGKCPLFVGWVLSVGTYILWIYSVLPELLFKGAYRCIGLKTGNFLFTASTAGVGPVIWYFARVDPVLRQMADAEK
jgi:hypothetical protein